MNPVPDFSKFAEQEAYERYRLAQYAIGLRVSLRSAYPQHENANDERHELVQEGLKLQINDLEGIEKALVYHRDKYKEEKILFTQKYGN